MPTLLDLLRAAGSGAAGSAVGWPADTAVNVNNLLRAAYGYMGNKAGLLSTEQMPEPIDPVTVPLTSAHIRGLLGVGDSGPEQAAEMVGGLLAPGPKGAKKMELTTYHGSPHKFDKFDMSKIGTGEGAQAYGHGLYFAENPDVAREYLVKGQQGVGSINRYHGQSLPAKAWDEIAPIMHKHDMPGDIMPNQNEAGVVRGLLDNYGQKLSAPERATLEKYALPKGGFYKVDIPDEAVAKMLHWDKPLSEQPEAVQKVAMKYAKPLAKELRQQASNPHNGNMSDATIWNSMTGQDLYNAMRMAADPKGKNWQSAAPAAAQTLRELGVPGIKYLDAGSRKDGGTHNYVLFDDNLAKILSRE